MRHAVSFCGFPVPNLFAYFLFEWVGRNGFEQLVVIWADYLSSSSLPISREWLDTQRAPLLALL